MKKSVFPLVLVFSLFVTFFSCSNKPKRSRKPVSTIVIQPSKKNYVFGEKVSVEVKTKVKNGEIENIQLFYENQLIKESSELEFTVPGVELNALGNNNFKVVATKTDGVDNSRVKSIPVVSDVVPKKYSYQIINNYPHLKSSFTEGLEFYKGFLYEGTGNNGESHLMKINMPNGNVVQTYSLDEIYFGEGITILNNKIYQLTYKAQKGFVYNLSDFALIDSFQYSSREGWGLTNDGTNLIMGNGTHTLTWLSPEDFSVIKMVQVADNKGLVNFINELEYIDGKILANVYTTNRIIEIDAETGKVIREINLDGIINMYTNPSDTLDYMNGIAYDKENDRLFVTGKYWPRLFEIKLIESE
ncbi:glutaminyl-peptide cyclotransferase [Maribellus comscasis]|nr:glutaminyl-peptide cyclotransferase [Maribellus comscasis]